jgi:CMP/dCMP kinase
MIIAVDGPSAAGKGTVARAIAAAFGFHFLDTGRLYRMVGLAMLRSGADLSDVQAASNIAASLDPSAYDDRDLRTEQVAGAASHVSAMPAVRERLLQFQRDFAQQKPGAVLDGRDIGTVVCPGADVKLYVTASAAVRARRRFDELRDSNPDLTFDQVLDDVRARDERDTNRAVAPLLPATTAVIIDTTEMTVAQAVDAALAAIESKTKL